MTGLLTDLYQLTMAAGFFAAGKAHESATFDAKKTYATGPGGAFEMAKDVASFAAGIGGSVVIGSDGKLVRRAAWIQRADRLCRGYT